MAITIEMKRKKQKYNWNIIVLLRRRYLHRPLISAVSASILLLFTAISLFLPSPSPLPLPLQNNSNSHHHSAFQVPESGCGSCGRDIWTSTHSHLFSACSNAQLNFTKANVKTHQDRYLLIATSGGLNQQRTGIIDAVVAAYLLNATLVLPHLDHTSFWKDTRHAVLLTKFDYRLSNKLDEDLQKLRCRVNYHALKFTDYIQVMGKLLVERMRMKSKHFIALHLRFEPDMLAFSGCYYGGGENERIELGEIRKRWKNLRASNPEKVRRHGRCPLTPQEVGLMLRALGFGSEVHLYVASGEIYGGEITLAPLRALFPNFHSKETLATKEELAPFQSFSSRMAALDFIVCGDSDVFVTNNNGNMAKILAGTRRYMGHKPTIRPNAKKLNRLLMNKNNMTWEEFGSGVRSFQVGFMGEPNELRPGSGEFHENPSSCICQNSELKTLENMNNNNNNNNKDIEEQFSEEEWSTTDSSLPLEMRKDQAELQEFFSD
ncbi:unnamed protein product [Lupinus luteus]|uniref:O-fucosyltransferase family protein n=1 Tax=Lupinus luteus TaxID=3873 RepID=A0AAV1WDD8_LUPLU